MADESDFQLQNSAQAIEYGRETVKTITTLNGGAAIAVIGFIGNKDVIPSPDLIRDGLLWFCVGLALALCAFIAGYIAQTCFAVHNLNRQNGSDRSDSAAKAASVLGVGLVVGSAAAFIFGVYRVSHAVFGPLA